MLKISNWAQKVEVYLVAMSFLRESEKRKELDEKRKQLEEICHDEKKKKWPMSGMTAKLKLI